MSRNLGAKFTRFLGESRTNGGRHIFLVETRVLRIIFHISNADVKDVSTNKYPD